MKNFILKGLVITSTTALLLGFSIESYAYEKESTNAHVKQEKVSTSQIDTEAKKLEEGINNCLGLIEKMPDSMILESESLNFDELVSCIVDYDELNIEELKSLTL
ncbi:hypothetical protein SPS5912_08800 [Staphylococcus pseudintermedius]|uniref:hypothetical protein n=1 Tax=Staphylococcus pseudintermedius TaxID=283734 RepID=UPI000B8D9C33|nr:hypothetical protein [Staphylococcus pseudintermedius]ASQ51054.1 hypothetical protein SPS5912_08800 [Staphylococcus pseudintermedius]EGQ2711390.1 hypothetical protein [Staphylococcus pseudintermedius]EGQ2761815.1 hypothetical protein [Staphylococcus pseudintermedius]EGQ3119983.1 hypothetical protein [Staphylococcus pseudintermedius]EGQ3154507.1 hypothetical protein [Staphylococcus pseudintermedius]